MSRRKSIILPWSRRKRFGRTINVSNTDLVAGLSVPVVILAYPVGAVWSYVMLKDAPMGKRIAYSLAWPTLLFANSEDLAALGKIDSKLLKRVNKNAAAVMKRPDKKSDAKMTASPSRKPGTSASRKPRTTKRPAPQRDASGRFVSKQADTASMPNGVRQPVG